MARPLFSHFVFAFGRLRDTFLAWAGDSFHDDGNAIQHSVLLYRGQDERRFTRGAYVLLNNNFKIGRFGQYMQEL
jgi:hypothetical protein